MGFYAPALFPGLPPGESRIESGSGFFRAVAPSALKKSRMSVGVAEFAAGGARERRGKECGRRRQCAALLAACRAASWRACLRRTRAGGAHREVLHASVRGRVLGVLGLAGSVHESVQCA